MVLGMGITSMMALGGGDLTEEKIDDVHDDDNDNNQC